MKFTILAILSLYAINGHCEKLQGPLETGWKGKNVCEKIGENAHENILRCIFPPGVGHERHKHHANFGYAISGGKVQIKDEKGIRTLELSTNSYFDSSGTKWHEILNVGETTIVYIILESK